MDRLSVMKRSGFVHVMFFLSIGQRRLPFPTSKNLVVFFDLAPAFVFGFFASEFEGEANCASCWF